MIVRTLFIAVVLAAGVIGTSGVAKVAPLPFQVARMMRTLAPAEKPQFSPDGTRISYALCDPRNDKASSRYPSCTIFILDRSTKQTLWKTSVGTAAWNPRWSPSGKYLTFIALGNDGKTHLNAISNAEGVRDLGVVDAIMPILWIDDVTILFVRSSPSENKTPKSSPYRTMSTVPGATATVYRSPADLPISERNNTQAPGSYAMRMHSQDLAAVNVKTGTRKIVIPGVQLGSFALAPDKKTLVYTTYAGFAPNGSQLILWNIAVTSVGKPVLGKVIARAVPVARALSWSPNGEYVAWFFRSNLRQTNVGLYDVFSKKMRTIALSSERKSFIDVEGTEGPLWLDNYTLVAPVALSDQVQDITRTATPTNLGLVDTRTGGVKEIAAPHAISIEDIFKLEARPTIVIHVQDIQAHTESVYRLQLPAMAFQKLATGFAKISSISASSNGKDALFVRETVDVPPDIWVAPLDNLSAAQKITDFNPELAAFSFGKARLLSYRDKTGMQLYSVVLLPPGWKPGKHLPLIVNPYGSDYRSYYMNYFGFLSDAGWLWNMHLFATRGYAVLLPDSPGRAGTPMTDVNRTVLAGVDVAIAAGIADPKRIGLLGQSNGGFSVFALIVQSNRFSTAIADAGFSDWATVYSQLEPDGSAHGISFAEEFNLGLGTDPWHSPEKYIKNSPFWYLDRVHTPLMIVHGTADSSVDSYNSAMTFVALRRLGKDVEYVSYAGEGHGPGAGWGAGKRQSTRLYATHPCLVRSLFTPRPLISPENDKRPDNTPYRKSQ